jgi:hypothetical protein
MAFDKLTKDQLDKLKSKNYISDWDWHHPHHIAYPWEMPLIRE